MKKSIRFNISSISSESATSFCENHSHSSLSESANQLSLNLESEPIATCEAVPDDLKLADERYSLTVQRGGKSWVCPVQLTAIETWRVGFAVEEGIEIDRLGAILEGVIDGGAA